jgi:hypothetical protein
MPSRTGIVIGLLHFWLTDRLYLSHPGAIAASETPPPAWTLTGYLLDNTSPTYKGMIEDGNPDIEG